MHSARANLSSRMKSTWKRPDPDILSQDLTQHLSLKLEPREEGRNCSPSRKKKDHLWVL